MRARGSLRRLHRTIPIILPTVALMVVAGAAADRSEGAELPHVHLLATGGTISGGPAGSLNAEGLLALIPEMSAVARVTMEDVVTIGSSRMTPEIQFRVAARVNALFAADPALAGIVITHGTDTLEETAFLLDLLVASDRPVVFAAAQRPPRAKDTDGPRNLLNAIRVAASPHAKGAGVLVTLNDEIHSARTVRKTHSVAVEAFQSPGAGPVGFVDAGHVFLARKPVRRLILDAKGVEPRVELITLVAGSDGRLVKAAAALGVKGLVVEVFGRGNVPPAVMDAVKDVRSEGVVVLFTTRTRGGRVEIDTDAKAMGVVSGEDLDGLKARMLLVAALSFTQDPAVIQSYVDRVSGLAGE